MRPTARSAWRLTSERATRLKEALDTLPLVQRLPIELAFFEGLTHVELVRAAGRAARNHQDAHQAGADEDEGRIPGRRFVSVADREPLRELASLHALGVLSADERAELARAMAADPELAAEVRQLEDTAGALGGVAAQIDAAGAAARAGPRRGRNRRGRSARRPPVDCRWPVRARPRAATRRARSRRSAADRRRCPAGWRRPRPSSWPPASACGRCSCAGPSTR